MTPAPKPPEGYESWLDYIVSRGPNMFASSEMPGFHNPQELAKAELDALRNIADVAKEFQEVHEALKKALIAGLTAQAEEIRFLHGIKVNALFSALAKRKGEA